MVVARDTTIYIEPNVVLSQPSDPSHGQKLTVTEIKWMTLRAIALE